MVYEFRWYCQTVAGVVSVQVAAPNEREACLVAEVLVRDLAALDAKKFRWRPGAMVETEGRL